MAGKVVHMPSLGPDVVFNTSNHLEILIGIVHQHCYKMVVIIVNPTLLRNASCHGLLKEQLLEPALNLTGSLLWSMNSEVTVSSIGAKSVVSGSEVSYEILIQTRLINLTFLRDVAFGRSIQSEIDSIMHNDTWELTDLPPGCKALGCKWILKRKMKVDGSIDKYKARLVIQGFRQKEGIDFFDIYAPVARISTIRLLLALAAIHDLTKITRQPFKGVNRESKVLDLIHSDLCDAWT
ncbi:zinc finger, CCHC-type containing protein [Tanacetum coccineum]